MDGKNSDESANSEEFAILLKEFEIVSKLIQTWSDGNIKCFSFFAAGIFAIFAGMLWTDKYIFLIIVPFFMSVGYFFIRHYDYNRIKRERYAGKLEERLNEYSKEYHFSLFTQSKDGEDGNTNGNPDAEFIFGTIYSFFGVFFLAIFWLISIYIGLIFIKNDYGDFITRIVICLFSIIIPIIVYAEYKLYWQEKTKIYWNKFSGILKLYCDKFNDILKQLKDMVSV